MGGPGSGRKKPDSTPPINDGVVDITPKMAKNVLDNFSCDRRRTVSTNVVSSYARDLLSNAWFPESATTIKFDVNGKLADGYHRMKAIVKSGVTMKGCIIVHGITESSSIAIDCGRPRSASDHRSISFGDASAKVLCSVANTLGKLIYNNNGVPKTNSQKISFREQDLVIEHNRKAIDFAVSLKSNVSKFTAPVMGALAYVYPLDPVKVSEFADCVKNCKGGSTAIQFMTNWIRIKSTSYGGSATDSMIHITLTALHAHLNGIRMAKKIPDSYNHDAFTSFLEARKAAGLDKWASSYMNGTGFNERAEAVG